MSEDTAQSLVDLVEDWKAQALRWSGAVPQGTGTGWQTGPAPSAYELLEACADQVTEVLRTGQMPGQGLPGQIVRLEQASSYEVPVACGACGGSWPRGRGIHVCPGRMSG